MRLPTWNKPRILYLYEQFPKYIAIPIGCFDELKGLLSHYKITPIVSDERNHGIPIDVEFIGNLKEEQAKAVKELIKEETGGLSATVQRKDGQHPIIFMNLGKIRYSVSAKKQALKRSFEHRVIVCRTAFNILDDRDHNIQELLRLFTKMLIEISKLFLML